jgi:hypothetical protein
MRNWSLGAYERNGASGMWELTGCEASGGQELTRRRASEMWELTRRRASGGRVSTVARGQRRAGVNSGAGPAEGES